MSCVEPVVVYPSRAHFFYFFSDTRDAVTHHPKHPGSVGSRASYTTLRWLCGRSSTLVGGETKNLDQVQYGVREKL